MTIAQAASRRQRADRLEALFREHHRHVLAYALRRAPDRADDIVAETFSVAWRRLDEVPADAEAWLYGVARNLIAHAWRGKAREQALISRLCQVHPRGSDETGGDDFDALYEALAALKDDDREALMLVHWEGLEPERAARALGIGREAFNQRVHRARSRLRSRLETTR